MEEGGAEKHWAEDAQDTAGTPAQQCPAQQCLEPTPPPLTPSSSSAKRTGQGFCQF